MKSVLVSIAASAALIGSAMAADLPSRKAPPPAYALPAPVTWTGFYVGVNAGGSFGGRNSVITATPTFAAPTFASEAAVSAALAAAGNGNNNNSVSFVGGGQVGYNWQWGSSWVAGFETDIQGFAGRRNNGNTISSGVPGFPLETIFSTNNGNSRNLTYLGTVRARLGFLATPNFLLYGTGGFAYGGGRTTTISQVDVLAGGGACTFCTPYNATLGSGGTKVGFTAGAGGEWMFAPNWSVKVEYLYYRLSSGNNGNNAVLANFFTPAGGGGLAWSSNLVQSNRVDGHIVRAGLNYHFGWAGDAAPVVARY